MFKIKVPKIKIPNPIPIITEAGKVVVDGAQTVGNAVVDTTQTVGNAVVDTTQTVSNAVVDTTQTVGNAVVDGAQEAIGAVGADELNSIIDDAQGFVNAGIDGAQNVSNVVVDAAQEVVDVSVDGTQAQINAYIDNSQNFLDAVAEGDWQGALGAVSSILIEGTGIPKLMETFVSLVDNPQPMTSEQIEKAKSVFGDSINYDLVRIDDSSHLIDVLGYLGRDRDSALTTFNTINSWGEMSDATLIHELTHVWQYQHHGAVYFPEAGWAQFEALVSEGDYKEAYNYGDVAGLETQIKEGLGLFDFNREQQAEIVEDYYTIKDQNISNDLRLSLYAHFVEEVSTLSKAELAPPIIGGAGDDELRGNIASNDLRGGDGDDYIFGDDGTDILNGEAGNDFLVGWNGSDTMYGEVGNDTLWAGNGDDQAYGGDGDDQLAGWNGNDYLDGENGNDELIGENGNDELIGGNGNDTLTGSMPSESDSGFEELDTLTGGNSADTFVLGNSVEAFYNNDGFGGYAQITDFDWAEGDKFQVFGSLDDYTVSEFGGGMDIYYQNDLIAWVSNTTDVIPSEDFIFA